MVLGYGRLNCKWVTGGSSTHHREMCI